MDLPPDHISFQDILYPSPPSEDLHLFLSSNEYRSPTNSLSSPIYIQDTLNPNQVTSPIFSSSEDFVSALSPTHVPSPDLETNVSLVLSRELSSISFHDSTTTTTTTTSPVSTQDSLLSLKQEPPTFPPSQNSFYSTSTSNLQPVSEIIYCFKQEIPPLLKQETPPLLYQETPPLPKQEETPPLLYQETPPLLYQETPPLLYQETPPLLYQETPPLLYQETPPLLYQETPPLLYQETPPLLKQEETPPLLKQETSPLPKQETPPLLKQETPPLPKQEETPPLLKQETPPLPKQETPPLLKQKETPPLLKQEETPPLLKQETPSPTIVSPSFTPCSAVNNISTTDPNITSPQNSTLSSYSQQHLMKMKLAQKATGAINEFLEYLRQQYNVTSNEKHLIPCKELYIQYKYFCARVNSSIVCIRSISKFLRKLGVLDNGNGNQKTDYVDLRKLVLNYSNTSSPASPLVQTQCASSSQDSTPLSSRLQHKQRIKQEVVEGEKDFMEYLVQFYLVTGRSNDSVSCRGLHTHYKDYCTATNCSIASSNSIDRFVEEMGVRKVVKGYQESVYRGMKSLTVAIPEGCLSALSYLQENQPKEKKVSIVKVQAKAKQEFMNFFEHYYEFTGNPQHRLPCQTVIDECKDYYTANNCRLLSNFSIGKHLGNMGVRATTRMTGMGGQHNSVYLGLKRVDLDEPKTCPPVESLVKLEFCPTTSVQSPSKLSHTQLSSFSPSQMSQSSFTQQDPPSLSTQLFDLSHHTEKVTRKRVVSHKRTLLTYIKKYYQVTKNAQDKVICKLFFKNYKHYCITNKYPVPSTISIGKYLGFLGVRATGRVGGRGCQKPVYVGLKSLSPQERNTSSQLSPLVKPELRSESSQPQSKYFYPNPVSSYNHHSITKQEFLLYQGLRPTPPHSTTSDGMSSGNQGMLTRGKVNGRKQPLVRPDQTPRSSHSKDPRPPVCHSKTKNMVEIRQTVQQEEKEFMEYLVQYFVVTRKSQH
ncbi:hypothetical protein Pmani_031863 [Petrolisthes manimaculis]|uniref:Uncharacterized protein n=1 Tax=Petrolisthes manimaculis TaxID=1843537 RepID=A0AAE1NU76_9EUCA|nr:hypothetical protein Pmani_031863 [Petrolisthes manimaculis]